MRIAALDASVGGLRPYEGCLGKGWSPRYSRHSIASAKQPSPPTQRICDDPDASEKWSVPLGYALEFIERNLRRSKRYMLPTS
jgi:hypothetical protein